MADVYLPFDLWRQTHLATKVLNEDDILRGCLSRLRADPSCALLLQVFVKYRHASDNQRIIRTCEHALHLPRLVGSKVDREGRRLRCQRR
jgi:hypothetical protein